MAKLYKCDQCSRQATDLNSFLTIASSNNSISITNNATGNNSRSLAYYEDLHFCSQKCLNRYLFRPLEQREILLVALKDEMESEAYKKNTAYTDNAFKVVIGLVERALNGNN